jgi:hypothetical protein
MSISNIYVYARSLTNTDPDSIGVLTIGESERAGQALKNSFEQQKRPPFAGPSICKRPDDVLYTFMSQKLESKICCDFMIRSDLTSRRH